METYTYLYTDTLNDLVSFTRLQLEIKAVPSLTSLLLGIDGDGTNINIYMSQALTVPEETALSGVIAAHTGAPYYTYTPILGTFSHAQVHDITTNWDDITGGVADLSNFGYNVADLVAMTKCELKTDGVGAELEMLESGGNALMSAPYACPDTGGVWQKATFYTNLPISAGDRSYVCRGRKNAVANASIRYMTLAVSVRVLQP